MKQLTRRLILCGLLLLPGFLLAQEEVQQLLHGLQYRNIGPANQGGRIVDIEAHNDDFTHVYLATGSGGVWKSENAGTTWMPIFDDYSTASIGDIALDQNQKNIIWVGTGEANNRNSVSWGDGVYKSIDGGESFVKMGLESTHHIARVLVHPDDSEKVCVCATGHLWGYSGDRGLFQTSDGGKSWQKLTSGLPDDGKTGCTDLVRDHKNPNILYAAFYHRLRKPWHFHSGGDNGGIYKSTDGGASWQKLTTGLPGGPTGRIGLAIYEKNPDILMALVEAPRSSSLDTLGSGVYRTEDGGKNWQYINTYNNRPFYYSQIRINPHDDQRVYLLTTSFMVSDDGGKTLRNGSADAEVHGDFHALWLDPNHPDRYYLGADKGFSITHDHGAHFQLIDNLAIAQFYRINYDMRDPYYVYGGLQDNGSYATASFSRDARGILNDSNWKMHWGDGQDAAANPDDWTDMYTSTENGSFFKYNPRTRQIKRISPNALNTSNFNRYFSPAEPDMESALRWNWSAPMVLSPHDAHTLYVGGNHIFKSTDQGKNWKIISPDLSSNDEEMRVANVSGGITPDNSGAETHCATYALSVSPIDPQVIWVGTDDGRAHVSKDDGGSWEEVTGNLEVPQSLWISRIETSHHEASRAYLTIDGHRSDDFGTYVWVTEDFGKTWSRITTGFADGEVVRVIREDRINPNLLFAGTETGVWFSLTRGSYWSRLKLNMPTVSVYDLKIHPRDQDLIVGTHGRSLWILDDISPLQQMNSDLRRKNFHLYTQRQNTLWQNVSRGGQRGHFWFAGDNPLGFSNESSLARAEVENEAVITYLVNRMQTDSLTMIITSTDEKHRVELKVPAQAGINRFLWNREFDAGDFSEAQQSQLELMMQRFAETVGNRRVTAANEYIRSEVSDQAKRARLETLASGYLSLDIPEEFLIPRARAGTYLVTLSDGNREEKTTLTIRADPLLARD